MPKRPNLLAKLCRATIPVQMGQIQGEPGCGRLSHGTTADVEIGETDSGYWIVHCNALKCSRVQCSVVRCSAVQCSAVQCIPRGEAVGYPRGPLSLSPLYSTVEYSTVQYSTVQYYINLTGEIHFQNVFSEIYFWIFQVCPLSQQQHTPLHIVID